jgi:hypothetical protein
MTTCDRLVAELCSASAIYGLGSIKKVLGFFKPEEGLSSRRAA